ncbi:MAG TPA: DNA/RNA non-specific endonuclease [Thermoanaerobaculia bacterium]|jgi:endonuclease G
MMVRRFSAVLLLCFLSIAGVASAASPNVVISQVYGGGGATTGTPAYLNDYVELFNTSNAAVPIGGWSLQYGSATGNFASSSNNLYAFPAGTTIGAGKYLVVKLGSAGTLGGTFTADLTTPNLTMSASAGKVALVNGNAVLGCGATATPCALPDARIVDLVAYGNANNAETTAVNNGVGLNSGNGALRKSAGCQDTDNNNSDFTVATTASGLIPRNGFSAANPCGTFNQPPVIAATANPVATVAPGSAFNVSVNGTDDNNTFHWSVAPGTGISNVIVSAGQSTATGTFTVSIASGFSGTATFTVFLSDTINPAVSRALNVEVTAGPVNAAPSIANPANPIATVAQNAAPFTVSLTGTDDGGVYNWSAFTGTGVSSVVVTNGQGTNAVTYTVTLNAGFNGTASFTAFLSDNFNPATSRTVNIGVTAPPPPAPDHIVISQVYGGGGNASATWNRDYVELFNPTTSTIDVTGWSIQYASSTGSGWAGTTAAISGPIGPGEYYLIQLSGGAVGSALPVLPNITGDINMSGTTGKIALVKNGDALSGNCPLSDPDLVDFVGFGSADCREGATNATAPANNTQSMYRKGSGTIDTNQNGSDFERLSAFPRRTAVISEAGPSISNTEPFTNGSNAPRDANIVVDFNEAVTVSGNWFAISCVTTGAHNDATVGANANGKSFTIIPNTPFINGEQCTVTIFANGVSDADLEDSGPNSDHLAADYTWSFSTSTGTAPPFPSYIHTLMGNPTGAVADVNQPNNYLMEKGEFALSYNRDRGTPNWVSWHLSNDWVGTLSRVDTFRGDSAVPADWYRVLGSDYSGSGFDRGHMVPNADRDKETSMPINQATFLMSNMIPQAPDNNQGPWADMENYLRTLTGSNELFIVAGGHGTGGIGSNGAATTVANGHVAVPAQTWKVVLVVPAGTTPNNVQASARTIAVILPNVQGIRNNDWTTYLTTVDAVEALTGYDFFANVPDAVENAIEAGFNGTNPPGVANQSVNTDEDVAKSFTLQAANPGSGTLTYTILSQPSHGTLSGSGANQTYTPAPEFSGSDSFTFRASSGSANSATATVSITVFEVNDAPTANADAYAIDEDSSLTINAAELTANDNAGEPGQTLTVTTVNGATLNNGVVTYTPAANFNGNASFTYTVCDNGSASECATGTVNVTVNAVNDAPAVSLSAPAAGVEGSAITASASSNDQDGDTLTTTWTVTKNGAPYGSSPSFTPDDNGTYTVTVTVTDGTASASDSASITVSNVAPAITAATVSAAAINENGSVTVTGALSDPGSADTHVVTVNWGDGSVASAVTLAAGANAFSFSHQYLDNGNATISIAVADDDAGTASAGLAVAVANVAPVITATNGPASALNLGGTATVSVSFTDAGTLDTHTALFTWDDGSTSTATCAAGTCTASRTYAAAGTYGVAITVTDDDGGSASTSFNYVVVVDATSGFMTAGGFIDTPAGKGHFNVNAKYKKGGSAPEGKTSFKLSGSDFDSTNLQWLVVNGANAQLKGTGTINGTGNYTFLLTATDATPDKFRIRIWNTSTGVTVYDNVPAGSDDMDAANPQPISGGSIQLH